jgi:hypothetical protein
MDTLLKPVNFNTVTNADGEPTTSIKLTMPITNTIIIVTNCDLTLGIEYSLSYPSFAVCSRWVSQ